MSPLSPPPLPLSALQRARERVLALATAAGFSRCGISTPDLGQDAAHLADWLGRAHGGQGIVLVSHDHAFIDQVCTRVVEVGA